MDIEDRLDILADAAKYDVSCSSSGSSRPNRPGGLGNAHYSGICHSWTADGRCISLLKILMTNSCIYDCEYCVNRRSNDTPRAMLTPEEIVLLTIEFYRRNYIEGLFLSSGIVKSPDYTTELLIRTAKLLREREHFNGYIHMKGIPGTDPKLLNELGRYVDRVSVNIELPSEKSLHLLAPQKTKQAIMAPMKFFRDSIRENKEEIQESALLCACRTDDAAHRGSQRGKRPADSPSDAGTVPQGIFEESLLFRVRSHHEGEEPACSQSAAFHEGEPALSGRLAAPLLSF